MTDFINLISYIYVKVSIFNHLGEKVKNLTNEEFDAGENKIIWKGLNNYNNPVSSGIYLYKIISGNKVLHGKMIIQK
ncbi:MAG: T9SS type A sorting domain-containing protein [Ignavibacteriaceae bacterium]|nr:T9SS type A sorting domain-containing protein [Ignavibacteriaceae bacterium]